MTRTLLVGLITVAAACSMGGSKSSAIHYAGSPSGMAAGPAAESTSVSVSADRSEGDDDGGGGSSPAAPAPSPATSAMAGGEAKAVPEKLVIEGYLRAEVDDVKAAAAALRQIVEHAGGRVINEDVSGAAQSWNASLKLRVPPGKVDGVVELLAGLGEITSKRISASDVSRTLFEAELEIGNKRAALDRLRKLLDQGGLVMADVLAIEREMTRLRGEIEQLEGTKRFLEDRVALATLDVYLTVKEGHAVLSPSSKFYPGPRFAIMTLLDAEGRTRNRLGGGLAIHIVPRLSFELDVFQSEAGRDEERSHAVVASFGGSVYSDFLGRGRRSFLNPYLGLRLGYAYLDGGAFAAMGDAGVELFKTSHVMIDLNTRLTALLGEHVDTALITGLSAVVAF